MKLTPDIRGAALASQFAQEIGLPPGNYWEGPIARSISVDLRRYDAASVEADWRLRLGLAESLAIHSGAPSGRWWIKTADGGVLEDGRGRRRFFATRQSAERCVRRVLAAGEG